MLLQYVKRVLAIIFIFHLFNHLVEHIFNQVVDRKMTDKRLSEVFHALADPNRRKIVDLLREAGELKVGDIAQAFHMSLNGVSKHLKVLERAGLIVRGRRAQYRPCTIDPRPLEAVSSWAEQYRPVWESRLDRMDDYLRHLQDAADDGRPAPDLRSDRPTTEHDEKEGLSDDR